MAGADLLCALIITACRLHYWCQCLFCPWHAMNQNLHALIAWMADRPERDRTTCNLQIRSQIKLQIEVEILHESSNEQALPEMCFQSRSTYGKMSRADSQLVVCRSYRRSIVLSLCTVTNHARTGSILSQSHRLWQVVHRALWAWMHQIQISPKPQSFLSGALPYGKGTGTSFWWNAKEHDNVFSLLGISRSDCEMDADFMVHSKHAHAKHDSRIGPCLKIIFLFSL